MSDDTNLRAPEDASRISLEEDYEVRYWTQKWSITREQLEEAVNQVGHSASAVAIFLQKPE